MCLTKCLKLGIVPLYCWRLWCLWFFMETSRPLFNIFLFQNWPRGGIRSYLKDNVKCDDCGVNVIAPDCLPCLIRLIHPTNKNYFLNLSLSKIDLGAVFNQPISSVVMYKATTVVTVWQPLVVYFVWFIWIQIRLIHLTNALSLSLSLSLSLKHTQTLSSFSF